MGAVIKQGAFDKHQAAIAQAGQVADRPSLICWRRLDPVLSITRRVTRSGLVMSVSSCPISTTAQLLHLACI
jgi:hypothetical protein